MAQRRPLTHFSGRTQECPTADELYHPGVIRGARLLAGAGVTDDGSTPLQVGGDGLILGSVINKVTSGGVRTEYQSTNVTIPDLSGVGFSPAVTVNTIGRVGISSPTSGGMALMGFSSSASNAPLYMAGYHGSTSPTAAAIQQVAYKHNGTTGRAAIAATEKVLEVLNSSTSLVTVLGNGDTTFVGQLKAPSAVLDSTVPYLDLNESDAASGSRLWRLAANSAAMTLSVRSDDGSTSTNVISVSRTGQTLGTFDVNAEMTAIAPAAGANNTRVPTTAWIRTNLITNKISVGTSAPGSPATNDIWVDTN